LTQPLAATTPPSIDIREGDCRDVLKTLPSSSVNCIVTSPPYFGLRDYGVDRQMGLEPSPDEFAAALVGVLHEARRVLRDDGTLWLNLGDSYAGGNATGKWREGSARADGDVRDDGHSRRNRNGIGSVDGCKPKDLIGIPWRVAFALQADGWYLRQDIIWHKPNPMPESVRDRCTKAHEYIFLLSKSERYYFDSEAMKEPIADPSRVGERTQVNYADESKLGRAEIDRHVVTRKATRNRRSVWTVATRPFSGAHFATFPPDLIEPCILAGCPKGGTVLDPFFGAGTTGLVAQRHGRNAIGIELNPEYVRIAKRRLGLPETDIFS
jgi:DNA modification methylase